MFAEKCCVLAVEKEELEDCWLNSKKITFSSFFNCNSFFHVKRRRASMTILWKTVKNIHNEKYVTCIVQSKHVCTMPMLTWRNTFCQILFLLRSDSCDKMAVNSFAMLHENIQLKLSPANETASCFSSIPVAVENFRVGRECKL